MFCYKYNAPMGLLLHN